MEFVGCNRAAYVALQWHQKEVSGFDQAGTYYWRKVLLSFFIPGVVVLAKKTFRTICLDKDLERRLRQHAENESSSVSRIVRIALKQYLVARGVRGIEIDNQSKEGRKIASR